LPLATIDQDHIRGRYSPLPPGQMATGFRHRRIIVPANVWCSRGLAGCVVTSKHSRVRHSICAAPGASTVAVCLNCSRAAIAGPGRHWLQPLAAIAAGRHEPLSGYVPDGDCVL
jgi:hypothetical protein